jgi:ABC-type amino acid transport substrate-binding protein
MKALLKWLCPILCCTFIHAEEIKVATEVWEGYTTKDEKGFYIDLLRKVYPEPEFTLKIEFVPYKRSIKLLNAGKVDIMLGAYPEDIPRKLQSTHPVESDSVSAVITKELSNTWQSSASLAGKNVVAKTGYGFGKYIPTSVNYTEVPSLKSMLLMLKRGRVDAVLDYEKDIQILWEETALDNDYVMVRDVIIEQVFFGFAENRTDLKARFDQEFRKLYQSGSLKTLFLKHSLSEARVPKIQY